MIRYQNAEQMIDRNQLISYYRNVERIIWEKAIKNQAIKKKRKQF